MALPKAILPTRRDTPAKHESRPWTMANLIAMLGVTEQGKQRVAGN